MSEEFVARMIGKIQTGQLSADDFLRHLFGYSRPRRNDCGCPRRPDFEDTSRMHGWGPEEGEGPCDYPSFRCEWLADGRCPFFEVVDGRVQRREEANDAAATAS